MLKKFGLTFLAFFILLSANLFFVTSLSARTQKVTDTQKILEEIDHEGTSFGSSSPLVFNTHETQVPKGDNRVANLKNFFRTYNSPLYDYADLIVNEADKNSLDYRLIPAIAMQESTLCRTIPNNSYNCWGWGIYGNTVTRFDSYADAISTISKGLKKNYIDHGLITAVDIMSKYNPSSNGSWAHGVNTFLEEMK